MESAACHTLTEAESANLADLAQTIRSIAAGGFLEYAEGGWLDLLADGLYDERRKPSVFTQGTIRLTDAAGAGPFTIVPGQLWASDIGRTRRFTNLVGGSLPLSGTLDLTWQAESPGASWNLASRRDREPAHVAPRSDGLEPRAPFGHVDHAARS
jgi:hypothetical protein